MKLKQLAQAAWRNEPVLLGAIPPMLVFAGLITAAQASAVTAAVQSVTAAAVSLIAAFSVRSAVKPTSRP